ncbi:hypothetical protein J2TS6_13160 [Paenibacillus albilobatus]|uniref:Maltogenic Amylase C-terminal domain-containing protein n=1 Tax=Paenibacillus albilobatus TaxID=2716884 RepID=A0A920C8Q5_9BACL|nr:hypothetical protein [Paenibacillus albilobatus]GIO30175.1 hypothetical protein J2TS6_13160 [Paenibacillus albilobatus]
MPLQDRDGGNMNGSYWFESVKCMALTLQLIQGAPMGDAAALTDSKSSMGREQAQPSFKKGSAGEKGAFPRSTGIGQGEVSRKSLLDFYDQLAMLRSHPFINELLAEGKFRLAAPEHAHVFAYERSHSGRRLLTVSNWSKEPLDFALERDFVEGEVQVSVYPEIVLTENMRLRPYEAFAVLVQTDMQTRL